MFNDSSPSRLWGWVAGALEAVEAEQAVSPSVILPLVALTLLLLIGAWLRRRVEAHGHSLGEGGSSQRASSQATSSRNDPA